MTAARATTAWETSLDPALVARLARPLRRPGLISLALVRRIHGAIDALLSRLSLLARFTHKLRELAAPETPIVHAHAAPSRSAAAPSPTPPSAEAMPPPPLPIVRGTERVLERTIAVERVDRPGSSHSLDSRPEPSGDARDAPITMRESAPAHVELGADREAARARNAAVISVLESHERVVLHEQIGQRAPHEQIESRPQAVPLVPADSSEPRRSRMGAPIVRRITAPRALPSSVERIAPVPAPAPARSAAAPTMKSRAATEATAMTPLIVRPTSAAPASTPLASALKVRVQERRPPTAPIVAASHTRRLASTAAPQATPPVVLASASRAPARPALEQPLAHLAPLSQALAGATAPTGFPLASAAAAPAVPAVAVQAPSPLPTARREPSSPAPPPAPKLDLHEIADHVQRILTRRALQERERRGLPR